MANSAKGIEHDASPSWHGYNYQGKVGLYVCLAMINKRAQSIESADFFNNIVKEFESYSIEYEWVEDFSIKNHDEYISFHQVKHKKNSSFNQCIEAISTIFDKILGRFPEYKIPKKTNQKDNLVPINTIQELVELSYLDENNFIQDLKNISNETEIIKILKEYKSLSEKIFSSDKKKIYLHTSNIVKQPKLTCLFKYEALTLYQDYLKNKYDNFPNAIIDQLQKINLNIGFDDLKLNSDYKIVLNDDALKNETNKLIRNLINKLEYQNKDTEPYYALLLKIIDQHISDRKKLYGSKLPRPLFFTKFINVFKDEIVTLNEEHHEARSTEHLYDAIEKIFYNIEDYFEQSLIKELRLDDSIEKDRLKKIIIVKLKARAAELCSRYPYMRFLESLSMHIQLEPDKSFKESIRNKEDLYNLIQNILEKNKYLSGSDIPFIFNEKKILPSCINVRKKIDFIRYKNNILDFIKQDEKNYFIRKIINSSHIWYEGKETADTKIGLYHFTQADSEENNNFTENKENELELLHVDEINEG